MTLRVKNINIENLKIDNEKIHIKAGSTDGDVILGQFNLTSDKLFVIGNGSDENNKSDALTVDDSGTVTATKFVGDGSELTNLPPSGSLAKVTENSKTGYRIADENSANHCEIGRSALDLSIQTSFSSTRGASGDYSIAMGFQTTASGEYSTAMGLNTQASGKYCLAIGKDTTTTDTLEGQVKTSGQMNAQHFYTASDNRIKTEINEINDNQALDDLLNMKPCTYLKKGKSEYGFLAQEMKQVLPTIVTDNDYEFIPLSISNVNVKSKDDKSCVIELSQLNDELKVDRRVSVKDGEDEKICKITNISGNELTLDIVVENNEIVLDRVEVDDFHYVNTSEILPVAVAAIQELNRVNQQQAEKLADLETRLANLETN